MTCRDLGYGLHDGHDAKLWPKLMIPLAATWGKDAQFLQRRLTLFYTGLPRGRVTRPEKTFLILHGEDSPDRRFAEMVKQSFWISGQEVKFLFDEHETMIPGHPRAVEASLGHQLYGRES